MKNILLIFIFSISLANAGLLIEPYAGYGITALEATNGGGGSPVEWGVKGTSYGFRGGLSTLGLFLAFDYEKGSRSFEIDAGSSTITVTDMDLTNVGFALGYDLPIIPLRIWGKMITKSELKENATTWSGKGMGVGLGFTLLPIIDINIEAKELTYDEGIGSASEIKGREIMIGISAPFTL